MKPLPPPTPEERKVAAEAAKALRAVAYENASWGTETAVHVDYSRPRRSEWITTWANLPGFSLVNEKYRHALLPGWEYNAREVVKEMIPDLEALAEHGIRPTEATS